MPASWGRNLRAVPAWLRRFGPLRLVPVPLLDKVVLHYYFLSAMVGALMNGAFSNGNMVLKKTLGATDIHLGVLHAIGAGSLLLGIIGSEMVSGRDKRPFILLMGILSRGIFLAFLFVNDVPGYIMLSAVFVVCNSLLIPAQTSLWHANIGQKTRNEMWGLSVSIGTFISMASAFAVGWLLDHNPYAYRYIFPVAGVLGIISTLILIRAPIRQRFKIKLDRRRFDARRVLVHPVQTFLALMKRDPLYLRFEAAFFLYGVAFMITAPLLPGYLSEVAHMNFKQASICEGVLFQAGSLLTPLWGRLMDRRTPTQLCAIVFALLACFPATLLLGPHMTRALNVPIAYGAYLAYALYGLAMAGLGVAWNLAPIVFAGKQDSSNYTGAHVTITGIRGVFAPIAGGALGETLGSHVPVFSASIVLFLCAAAGMLMLEKQLRARLKAAQEEEAQTPAPATSG
ncbi:MFS transporter [bacterium]|nr:MFS transporter [bacterium]